MELAWTRDNKRHVSPDGSGYRWTAEAESGGVKVSARIVTEPFGSPGRYRLALSVNGAELPPSEHERLQWAQEAAVECCETLARLESPAGSATPG